MTQIADTKDFDIIHAHDWMTFLAAMELKEKHDKPLILHVHSLDYDRGGPEQRGWIYELEKKALSKADAILPVSRYTANVLESHYGIAPEKMMAIHNGIDPVKISKQREKSSSKTVLFLGRVTYQKGVDYFPHIIEKVLEELGRYKICNSWIWGSSSRTHGLFSKTVVRGSNRIYGIC